MMLFEKKVLSCRTFQIKKQSDRNMADEKIIFSMNGVGKVLPNSNKVILKDIYLSFFYGATCFAKVRKGGAMKMENNTKQGK